MRCKWYVVELGPSLIVVDVVSSKMIVAIIVEASIELAFIGIKVAEVCSVAGLSHWVG